MHLFSGEIGLLALQPCDSISGGEAPEGSYLLKGSYMKFENHMTILAKMFNMNPIKSIELICCL
jgi:hypothetical protein